MPKYSRDYIMGMKPRINPFRGGYNANPSPECYGVCIPLSKGYHVIIDCEDYDRVCNVSWCYDKGYAANRTVGFMHRIILDTPDGLLTDHISGNRLDNRKSNLRPCNHTQNQCNRGHRKVKHDLPFKGVYKQAGKYQALISVNKKHTYIGLFDTAEEAAKAYDSIAVTHYGEFVRLNIPNSRGENYGQR